jgi:hypothetical protein
MMKSVTSSKNAKLLRKIQCKHNFIWLFLFKDCLWVSYGFFVIFLKVFEGFLRILVNFAGCVFDFYGFFEFFLIDFHSNSDNC